VRGHLRA